jgi:Ca-activated chloride channel family protein
MKRHTRGPIWLTALTTALVAFWLLTTPQTATASPGGPDAGSLGIIGKDGKVQAMCPLKHTDVRAAISGFLARVTVTQIFENNAKSTIEAVYTFPLPQDAAVDDMTIRIGERTVKGLIKRREEARDIYEKAKQTGHVAALLDQERPNIFTQSVANIVPGEQVTVTISYIETLRYEEGSYEFVFPTVVGPRYIPGAATGKQGGGWAPDTDRVPDASRITPPVAVPGTRAGHDISIDLALDAGVPIQELRSKSHQIDVDRTGASSAHVRLRDLAEIPNKDFILKYDVAGKQIEDAVLTAAAPAGSKVAGGYFTLILQSPARVQAEDVTPKELVFVVDTSGSMMGFPIEQAKKLINRALDELYPGDTFNLITFSGDTEILFPEPVYPTAANIRRAKKFLESRSGGGGTEMMKAIRAALDPSDKQDHIRVVCFATDGYVGNDMEIIGEIQKHPNARVFSFGIGNSVNRFLLDGMAKAGRGAVEYVTLQDKADEAAKRLYERLRAPLLTDVSVDWNGLPISDVYPARLPDLFSGQPLIITGRYSAPAKGTIRLRGTRAGEAFTREIPVVFSADAKAHTVLASFWARKKIDDLMSQDWAGAQRGSRKPEIEKQVTQLGLDYRLMTQFTSFVAVEERVVTKDGKPMRVELPVEMPQGVSYEGVFGEAQPQSLALSGGMLFSTVQTSVALVGSAKRESKGRVSGGVAGGIMAKQAPPPSPPPTTGLADKPETIDAKPTPERALLESKFDSAVLAAFDCWKKSPSTCTNVHEGKIQLQILLTGDSAAVVDEIKTLGFELREKKLKTLTGLLPIDKLEALAKMKQVRFVSTVRR